MEAQAAKKEPSVSGGTMYTLEFQVDIFTERSRGT
jgi:hypothetical protein